ncbi:TIR domain-containing protein [Oleiharenicola lentus]|uniref:TIR domain-containing protein n=1 Tax=Oleiharenicola lentus TaxID=2508720 RepID=A0A4V1M6A8_9BACT|nr:TIR domain-containing protein [Oleiharenicola lentus]RXK54749.1 TIR domain-containing protein [Oleiharenicola lentus]
MSDSGKAVFLSYASQDAEAAKRICEALRAAGVEVWFDAEGGLEHGDEWDAKIRRQIKECVLFLPIISANTQAREEGYFRIEWDLAAERARGIASGVAFILPVVIDDTKQPDALVPDRFRTVQWTKLPGGVVPPEVLQRLLKLWSHRTGALKHQAGSGDARGESRDLAPGEARLDRPGGRTYAAIAAALFALVAVVGWWLLRSPRPGPAPAAAQATESEARRQVYEAHRLVQSPEGVTRERLAAADEMCRRALALDSLDPVVLAVAARIDANWVFYQFDKSEERKQQAASRAERAAVLAPQEPMVRLARAQVFAWVIGTPSMQAEAERMFRELSAVEEVASAANLMLGILLRDSGRTGEAATLYEKIGDLHNAGWAYLGAQRPEDAARVIERQLKDGHNRNALVQKLVLNLNFREDLHAVGEVIAQFTPSDLQQDSPAGLALNGLLAGRNADRLLEVVNGFPREVMASPGYLAPKRVFSGWAHHLAGRAELARTEWSAALATVQELRRNRTDDVTLLLWQALLQSRLGLEAEADATVHLIRSVTPVPTPGLILRVELSVNAALGRTERFWATLAAGKLPADERTPTHSWLRFSPDFDVLRADPRFQAFLRENLPPGAKAVEPVPAPTPSSLLPAPARPSMADDKSVAVLAFANLSDDKGNEYFSDGISEELMTVLQKIPGLHVAARSSAFSFKGTKATAQEIGAKLGVAHLVEGSVQKSGGRVKITARLSRVTNGEELWSKSFPAQELKDVFVAQEEIARAIVGELRERLTGALDEKASGEIAALVRAAERGGTQDPEAQELFLQGRFAAREISVEGAARAENFYRRATERDPKFARAWVGLGESVFWQASNAVGPRTLDQAAEDARRAIQHALALEPELPEGLLALAGIQYSYDLDAQAARATVHRVLAVAPTAPVLAAAAGLESAQGHQEAALALARRAVALDPLDEFARETLRAVLFNLGHFDELQAEWRRALAASPDMAFLHGELARWAILEGRWDEAERAVVLEKVEWSRDYLRIILLWRQGRKAEAEALLPTYEQNHAGTAAYQIALVYADRGDREQAFAWLERAYRHHDGGIMGLRVNPFCKSLHGDPRWQPLLRKLGLAEEQVK